jgi:hypothetical protein
MPAPIPRVPTKAGILGDRVLALVVSGNPYALSREDEGALTRRVHALVRWEACAKDRRGDRVVGSSGFDPAEAAGGRSRGPIVGSALEAVIAALYLDGGMDAARGFIARGGSRCSPIPAPTPAMPRPDCRNGRKAAARLRRAGLCLKAQAGPITRRLSWCTCKVQGL